MLVRGPDRDQPERVRLRRLADEPRVRERDDERHSEHRANRQRDPRSRGAELDPRGEDGHEQRGQEEQVPVLHAVRGEARGERRDDERRRDQQSDRRGEVLLHRRGEPWRANQEHDERDDGHDEHVERQPLDVPEPEPEHLADVVAALADDAVGAEQVGQRPVAQQLGAEHENGEPDDPGEQRSEAPDDARRGAAQRGPAARA